MTWDSCGEGVFKSQAWKPCDQEKCGGLEGAEYDNKDNSGV